MIDSTELNRLLDGVEGFLHPDEPAFLASLAAQVSSGQGIVEIGSFRGRSTIALAYGAPDGVVIYAVDPHDEHSVEGLPFGMTDNQVFMRNVSGARMGFKIRVINQASGIAILSWRLMPPIGLLFVDGSHEFEDVDSDVRLWSGYLVPGGLLALHDSAGTWEHPTEVADELAASADWTELDGCAYTRVFRKGSK